MKHLSLFVIFIGLLILPIRAQKLVILSTSDLHSKLTGFGPENAYSPMTVNDDATLGGFARIATLINEEEKKAPGAVLTVDAGDFLMGTIFHADEARSGFQLRLMKDMGYDIVTVGNHEFDYGPNVLAQIINSSLEKGDVPLITASQFIFPEDANKTKKLKQLFDKEIIKPYHIINRNGIKIGVFGLIGEDAVSVAPAAKPLAFSDMYETAAEITNTLKNTEKVHLIICLSHSGLTTEDGKQFTGEDVMLAEKVPDIDIIISGHTHLITPEIIKVGHTHIVQSGAYGKNVAKLDLEFKDSKLQSVKYRLLPVDDKIPGDKAIHKKIEHYKQKVNERFFKPFGLSYSTPIAHTDFDLIRSTGRNKVHGNLGNFTADAIKFYTDQYAKPTDIAIIANGTIREHILKGEITPADVFRVLPLGSGQTDIPGNSLAMIYITPKELKKLSEVIIMNNTAGTDSYLYVAGMEVYYNPKKMMLRKVQRIEINGKELDLSKKNKTLIALTADTYLLQFVGRIKKMSKGLVKIVPKDQNGEPVSDIFAQVLDYGKNTEGLQEGKQWLAVTKFIESFKTDKPLAQIPAKYKKENKHFHAVSKKN